MADNDNAKIIAYFQRHGQTQANAAGTYRGPLNIPLDDKGIADAHEAADYFKDIDLGQAFTSDKDRAQDTARAILQPKNSTYTADPNLRAWNVGYLAGQDKASTKDDIGYFQRHTDVPIPKGESLDQFRDRVQPAILRSLQSGIDNDKPSLTVTHSSVIRELSNMLHGDHTKVQVYPGGTAGVTYDGSNFNVIPLRREKIKAGNYGE